jgi:hypothetical protein
VRPATGSPGRGRSFFQIWPGDIEKMPVLRKTVVFLCSGDNLSGSLRKVLTKPAGDINLVQVQELSFALEKTTDFEQNWLYKPFEPA